MKCWMLRGLCLALGLGATTALAEEVRWRPAGTTPAAQAPNPSLGLRPPVPVVAAPMADSAVQPAGFNSTPIFRARINETPPAPLPVGTPIGTEITPAPRMMPVPAPGQVIMQGQGTGPAMVPGFMPPADGQAPTGANTRWIDEQGVVHHGHPGGVTGHGQVVAPGRGTMMMPGQGPMMVPGQGPIFGGMIGHGGNCDCGTSCGGALCGDACCPDLCCDSCCPGCFECPMNCERPCFWISGEYLLWSIKPQQAPPLLTRGTTFQTPGLEGALNQPGTEILYGGGNLQNALLSGGRFTIGAALPGTRHCGIETTFFFLGQRSQSFSAGIADGDVIARPLKDFTPPLNGQDGRELVQHPDQVNGTATVTTSSKLWGAEVNLRKPLCCGCYYRLDGLLGFRFFSLEEQLGVFEDLVLLGRDEVGNPTFAPNTVSDNFSTRNRFYGGQIGLDGECRHGRWFLGGTAKVALGSMSQTVQISGNQVFSGNPTVVSNTGIFALGTNSGIFEQNKFCVMPEIGIKLGYNITDHCRIYAGYNFLYVSNVVRPGDQIDLRIDARQFATRDNPNPRNTGAVVPRPLMQTSDFWAHGVSFGLELKY